MVKKSAEILSMITVTRLNGEEYYLNPSLIETIEMTPDTIIKLTTDKKLIIKESADVVVQRIIEYNQEIFLNKTRTK